jgi:hypothetical protein
MEVFLQANFLTAAVSQRNSAARGKWEKKLSQLHVRAGVAADHGWSARVT